MLPIYTSLDGLTFQTFTLILGSTLLLIFGITVYALRWQMGAGRIADLALSGLIVGVIFGRAGHVAVHWDYFVDHQDEITRLAAGGLNWHGAVVGALIGVALIARLRRIPLPPLLDVLAMALPLGGLLLWWGCTAPACGYGAEVDNLSQYPSLLVWEARDVYGIERPRFNTQLLGMLLAASVGLIALILVWRGWLRGQRLWPVLAVFALGMFAIGFLRGDHSIILAGLRLDQWLDLGVVALALLIGAVGRIYQIIIETRLNPGTIGIKDVER